MSKENEGDSKLPMGMPIIIPDFAETNRIIYMGGSFNETKAEQIVTKLLHYECADPTKDVLMIIDSYGGYVDSFVAIHDMIKLLRCDVATVCVGKAMSCGQMLLMSGKRGKRFITPNSRVLIHEIQSMTGGRITDVEIDFNEAKRMQKEIFEKFIIKYTKITKTQLNNMMKQDNFFNAKESQKLGIIDHIINSPRDLYKNINI